MIESLDARLPLAINTQLLKDINISPDGRGSAPRDFEQVGDVLFFQATTRTNGRELWKTDGTASGTVLVKDIREGFASGYLRALTNVNGTLYFTANDGTNGYELWKSDGTTAGTVMVKDIRVGSSSSNSQFLTNVSGTLYFASSDGNKGAELWKSDGTAAGTVMVKDIRDGAYSSYPASLSNVNGILYFWANKGTSSEALWKSDGTSAGTVLVKQIRGESSGYYIRHLANLNGTLYFKGNDGTNGNELWKSDGTSAGTVMVKDIRFGSSGSDPRKLTIANGVIYFAANDGNNGEELWRSDGTSVGTVLVKDIRAGSNGTSPYSLVNVSGTLFFAANDGVKGFELWKTDGTQSGTIMVKDVQQGSNSSYPFFLTNVNGTLFFSANDGSHGDEVWKSDGTAAGTVLVKEVVVSTSSPGRLTNFNGELFFVADDGVNGSELWKSNGTVSGTLMVKNIGGGTTDSINSYNAHYLTDVNGVIFFIANDNINGKQLWKSNGTDAGTSLVRDLQFGSSITNPNLTNVNGTLFFLDTGLWKTDGTALGTSRIGVAATELTNVNGKLYFRGTNSNFGDELWQSDGTIAGTVLVKDILPGSLGSAPSSLTNVNGTLYFTANDGTNGTELWMSNGTEAGTVMVTEIRPGSQGSFLRNFMNINGTLYFSNNGREIWKSDGTAQGTVLVRDIPGGIFSTYFTNVNGTLFFRANDGTHGEEVWKSDGTFAGTEMVKDIRTGNDSSTSPRYFTNVNGTLFFRANNGTNGYELWKSDGTSIGTVMVKDVKPGVVGSSPKFLTNVNGALYFSADAGTGDKLWKSNGTAAGTQSLEFFVPQKGLDRPRDLFSDGRNLYYSAVTDEYGRELWLVTENKYLDLTLTNNLIAENTEPNASIGAFGTTGGSQGDTFTYSLVSGLGDIDNWVFNISSSTLRTTTSFNFETKSSYNIRVRSTDQQGLWIEKTLNISVTDANESPSDIGLSATSIAENSGANATVGTMNTIDQDAGNTFTYTFVSGTGDTDNVSFDIGGSTLRATNSLDFESKSSYSVRVRSTDQGGLFIEKAFTITVTDVNEVPTNVVLSSNSIPENAGVNATVGSLSTTDPDFGNTYTYELIAGAGDADNAAFNLSGSTVRATNSFDFEAKSSYSIRARSTDQGGLFTEKAFTITVENVNEAPTNVVLSSNSIVENAGVNATVGSLTTTDPDFGNAFNYELISGAGDTDNAAFNIIGSTVRAANSFDFESKSSYSIRVRSTDQGGLFTEKTFTIIVADVNETPTNVVLFSTSIAENAGPNATVGSLNTTDPDFGNTFTYELIAGAGDADNAAFNISGSTVRATNSLDFESKSSYSIRVRSTDQGGLSAEKTFNIAVTNVNEKPIDIDLSPKVIAENAGVNDVVGALSTTDPDLANTFAYSLVAGLGDADNAAFNLTGSTLRATISFDFETQSSYSVRVRSTDQGGLTTEKAFTITVTNANETPTDIDLSSKWIAENAGVNALVGIMSTMDPDIGGTFIYTLVAGPGSSDNSAFNINGSNLVATNSFDFESKSSYILRLRATDQGGLFTEKTFTLTVTNVNESPSVQLSNVVTSVSESNTVGINVADVAISDDALGTNTISLTGPDAALFEVSAGKLKLKPSSLDFEAKPTLRATVSVDDPTVGASPDQSIDVVLNLSDINEAPGLVFANVVSSVLESTAAGLNVGDVAIIDDALGINSVSLSGQDAAMFEVSGGKLKLKPSPLDFETKPTLRVSVSVDDPTVGSTPDQVVNVVLNVTDVNEAPSFTLTTLASSVLESITTGLNVADIAIQDDAMGVNAISLSGLDAALFQVTGGKLKLRPGSLDFETKPTLRVTVSLDDPTVGNSPDQSTDVVLNVTDVNEAPTEVVFTNILLRAAEEINLTQAGVVADISVTDDALGTNELTLLGPDVQHFEIVNNKLRLKAGSRFDFESQSVFRVQVVAKDPSLTSSTSVSRDYVLNIDNVPEVAGVTILDGQGWNHSVRQVRIQFDTIVNLTNSAIEWSKKDVGGALVPFVVQTSVVNNRTVADIRFQGKYVDAVGLLDGSYDLTVRGDQVSGAATGFLGLSYTESFLAIRPKPAFAMNISLAPTVAIGAVSTLGVQLVGASGTGIRYDIDFDGDDVSDRSVLGGASIVLNDVVFTQGGSRTVQVTATRSGETLAQGSAVVDVVPYTVRGSRWISTLDVDADETVSPLDVLGVINWLNDSSSDRRYILNLDVDRDASISPLDVLAIINHINSEGSGASPSPFVSLVMNDSGASDGLSSNVGIQGRAKETNAKLFLALDGAPRREAVGAIMADGSFDLTDAAIAQLFGNSLEGDHLLTIGTVGSNGAWRGMDRRFTKTGRLLSAFELTTALQNGGLSLAWTSAGIGSRYRVMQSVEGQSSVVLADGLSVLSTRIDLPIGVYDLFVEAYDALGNKQRSQTVRVRIA